MDTQFQIRESLLTVTGALDLDTAEPFRDALIQIVELGTQPEVDLSGVASCDLASLQLLRSAVLTAAGQGTPLTIVACATAVRQACRQFGTSMDELLQGGR